MSADNLADWLLACIAADEEVARAAIGDARPDWVLGCEETSDGENAFWSVEALGDSSEWFADLGSRPPAASRGDHIARWDPARVLAECAAKRRIVAELSDLPHDRDGWGYQSCPEEFGECQCGRDARVGQILRLLAQPYSDRNGFRKEWEV